MSCCAAPPKKAGGAATPGAPAPAPAPSEGTPPSGAVVIPGLSGLEDVVPHLDQSMPLSVVIFGATGDLAKKKLFPALYQLMLLDHFPKHVNIVGYGRRAVVMDEFIAKQCAQVKEDPKLPFAEYTKCITFHAGGYDEEASYVKLDAELKEYEAGKPGNRLFFLSVPPTVFGAVSEMIGGNARATEPAFTHLIIEKPFGRDTATFNELNDCTSSLFKESQLFRIDHYLGKEVVLNIMSLRFGNQLFEPLWNKEHIECVEINFKEDLGTDGRGGYFDGFGIIRDIMQNHLLQVFELLAMEPPASMSTSDLIKSKEDLLKSVKTLNWDTEKCFLGQFTGNTWKIGGKEHTEPGYLEDPTVPEGSLCPTFASVLLEVDNKRWSGVPFLMKAGKGLDERMAEVRIKFKPQAYNGLMHGGDAVPGNELVIRIQPNEALYFKTFSKLPGLDQVVKPTVMDMQWESEFPGAYVADAYERMLLNAAKGDGSLFVSEAELVQAWRIFTPLLHQIDEQKPAPVSYPFGSLHPAGYAAWSAKRGVEQKTNWVAEVASSTKEELTALFNSLDTENAGVLDTSGVTELAKRFYDGRTPTEKKVSQIFSRLDLNGDGKVSLEVFLSAAAILEQAFGSVSTEFHSFSLSQTRGQNIALLFPKQKLRMKQGSGTEPSSFDVRSPATTPRAEEEKK